VSGCGFEHDDGAYVLGALSPEDRVAFERHLVTCESCARSVRELAGLPGLLARVPVEIVDPDERPEPVPVPDTLLPGLVRRARRTQKRRTWLTAGLVAAAAAVAIGAVGVATLGGGDDDPAPQAVATAPAETMQPVGAVPITATVALTSVGWGTRVDLTCEYDDDAGAGAPAYRDESQPSYAMYVRTSTGAEEQIASWRALPHKVLRIAAATAASRDEITEVEVRSSTGRTVLRLAA
jgi:hypothetical protein